MSTRTEQDCPEWCGGDDHQEVAAISDGVPRHWAMVSERSGIGEVHLTSETHLPMVELITFPSLDRIQISPSHARTFAAWLIQAADRADFA